MWQFRFLYYYLRLFITKGVFSFWRDRAPKTGQTITTEGGDGLSPNIFRQNSVRNPYEKRHFRISIFFQFLHIWKRTTITIISSGFAPRQNRKYSFGYEQSYLCTKWLPIDCFFQFFENYFVVLDCLPLGVVVVCPVLFCLPPKHPTAGLEKNSLTWKGW